MGPEGKQAEGAAVPSGAASNLELPAQHSSHDELPLEPDGSTPDNPIAVAIDRYIQGIRDVQTCIRTYVRKSIEEKVNELEKVEQEHRAFGEIVERHEADKTDLTIAETKRANELLSLMRKQKHSYVPEVLLSSLYVAMFSFLDTFISALIRALFEQKPDLYGAIDRRLSLDQIARLGSIDAVKRALLEEEIDVLRRKSYVEQFEYMERIFGLNLRQFSDWPAFVEAGQRRNLYVHCDGVVTDQYLEICKQQKVDLPPDVKPGAKYFLDAGHTIKTTVLMMRLGVTLGHTLWRKVLPEQQESAGVHLRHIVYEALQRRAYKFSASIARFALTPMMSKDSPDIDNKITTINLAIALKFDGAGEEAISLLDSTDLTAAIPEFALANAVLHDRFDDAGSIMRTIGPKGALVSEFGYHDWPLFREFRNSRQFLDAYHEIYGTTFGARVADAMRSEARSTAAALEAHQREYAEGRDSLEAESTNPDAGEAPLAPPADGPLTK